MRLFQFLLPLFTNGGQGNAEQIAEWRREALSIAGGYTDNGIVVGAWQDEKGAEYLDKMQNIHVALKTDADYARLLKRTADLFSDQQAFFVGLIGTANIVSYNDAVKAVA